MTIRHFTGGVRLELKVTKMPMIMYGFWNKRCKMVIVIIMLNTMTLRKKNPLAAMSLQRFTAPMIALKCGH